MDKSCDISSNESILSSAFDGFFNEISSNREIHDGKGKINESIVKELGKNLQEKKKTFFGSCFQIVSNVASKVWEKSPTFVKDFFEDPKRPSSYFQQKYGMSLKELEEVIENAKLKGIITLASESTSSGANSPVTKDIILEVLEEHFKGHPMLGPYRDYEKNSPFPLKNVGDFCFVDLGIPDHHITGIITYEGKDEYSLTVINTGLGVDYHPSLKMYRDPLPYTRCHLKGIEEEKMLEFIKKLKDFKEAPSSKDGRDMLYKAIKDLKGEFDESKSYTDYLQKAGSCAGRQELLLAKHMMSKNDYRRLKIILSEKAVLTQAKTYTSGMMSSQSKVVFLDSVQRLQKRYVKNMQLEMAEVMKETELRIKMSLSEAKEEIEPKIFGVIPQTPKHACEELKSFVEAIKDLQMGNFNGFDQKIKIFSKATDLIHLEKDYPEKNLEGNKIAWKIICNAFVQFGKNLSDQNYRGGYSKEEARAIITLSGCFHLLMNEENVALISSGEEELTSNKDALGKCGQILYKFAEKYWSKDSFNDD